jgi:WD40 repeat protein
MMSGPMLVPFEAPEGFDPSGEFLYLRFNPTGTRVAVATNDGRWVVIVDIRAGKQTHRFTGLSGLKNVVFLAEDQLLFQDGRGITIRNLTSGREQEWAGEELSGWGAWVNPRRTRIAVGRGGLHLYDLKTRKHIRGFAPLLRAHHTCVTFSPNDRFLALDAYCERESRHIQVWEIRREPLYRLFEVHSGDGDLGGMAFSPDNRLLAVSVEVGATIFDLEKGKQLGENNMGPSVTKSVRFSPSGRLVELVSFQGIMGRMNVKTGRFRQWLRAPEGHEVWACGVSRQGLAAGVTGAALLFWQLPEWKER